MDFAAFHVPVHLSKGVESVPGRHTEGENETAASIKCLVYIGMPDNPQFLGPQDPAHLAAHIARSRGPSGENTEYVYNLAEALEQIREDAGMDIEVDDHVEDIASRVRKERATLEAR